MSESTQSSVPATNLPRNPLRRLQQMCGRVFRFGRNVLALLMVGVLAMVFTPATDRVYDWLNVSGPQPQKADYIVCLGGGRGREASAAVLWHKKVAPYVIVCNRPGAAEGMKALVVQAGVPAERIIVDRKSYTTGDHAGAVASLPGIDIHQQYFAIVTDQTHSRRAQACFVKAGYKHIEFWAGLPLSTAPGTYIDHCKWRISNLPSVMYECAAIVKYTLQGKI